MARGRQSLLEDLFEITSKLQWWVGVALAGAFYLILHQFAVMELAAATSASIVSGAAIQSFIKGLASIPQYILPVIFLGAASVSLFSGRELDKV